MRLTRGASRARAGWGIFGVAIFLVSGGFASSEALSPSKAPPLVVPIRQVVLSDGEIRYFVSITLGKHTVVDAMLDTGSTGVRILAAAITDRDYTATRQLSVYVYNTGVRLIGTIGQATVTIGNEAATTAQMSVQVVHRVDCAIRMPDCPATRLSTADYRIGGNGLPKEGFQAILGVNMGPADAVNPLTRIGTRSWIIELPRPGEREAGKLIINPDADERAGYALFQVGAAPGQSAAVGGFHDAIQGCVTESETRAEICGPTLLDTGESGVVAMSPQPATPVARAAGKHMSLVFGDTQTLGVSVPFIADAGKPSEFRVVIRPRLAQARIVAGVLPYFALSVLYDEGKGLVGLKRRLEAASD